MDSGKARIGILGGTFNPLHIGHLILAQNAMERYDLSRTIFIPTYIPPHKNPGMLASCRHRAAMIEAAIEGDLRFEVSDIELQRQGRSYTVDTMETLHERYKGSQFFFMIGTDSLYELHLWKNIYHLLELCRFISMVRPGFEEGEIKLDHPWPEKLKQDVFKGIRVDVSSAEIRHRVAEGMSIRYLVPQQVEMYIMEHGLYRL